MSERGVVLAERDPLPEPNACNPRSFVEEEKEAAVPADLALARTPSLRSLLAVLAPPLLHVDWAGTTAMGLVPSFLSRDRAEGGRGVTPPRCCRC